MRTKVAITLTPKLSQTAPDVLISVPGKTDRRTLWETQRIELEFVATQGWIQVEFFNKPDLDIDMAVIVDRIEFFGISDPRFVWSGVYTPQYPEPWYSQQETKPPVDIPQQSYMGWNGTWRLEFDIPVFTWMHRTMNLGWLYQ